jgi:hypothetical protein
MTTYTRIWPVVALIVLAVLGFSVGDADAQCCGSQSVAYAPAAYQTYSPVTYQTYQPVAYQPASTGWYPGRFLDQMRMNFWGTPTTYTNNYAPTYTVGYGSTYYAARPVMATSYAPVSSGCCGASQPVVMRPVTPCCDSCGSTSAVYNAAPACSTCTASYDAPVTSGQYNDQSRPELAPQENPSEQRTFERPSGTPEATPEVTPEADPNRTENSVLESEPDEGSSTYLQPPQLFQPEDRTTQLENKTPVWTAVYHRPASGGVTFGDQAPMSRAELHAVGWTSVSN